MWSSQTYMDGLDGMPIGDRWSTCARQLTLHFSQFDVSPINKISFAHFFVNFSVSSFFFTVVDENDKNRHIFRSVSDSDALEKFCACIVRLPFSFWSIRRISFISCVTLFTSEQKRAVLRRFAGSNRWDLENVVGRVDIGWPLHRQAAKCKWNLFDKLL